MLSPLPQVEDIATFALSFCDDFVDISQTLRAVSQSLRELTFNLLCSRSHRLAKFANVVWLLVVSLLAITSTAICLLQLKLLNKWRKVLVQPVVQNKTPNKKVLTI